MPADERDANPGVTAILVLVDGTRRFEYCMAEVQWSMSHEYETTYDADGDPAAIDLTGMGTFRCHGRIRFAETPASFLFPKVGDLDALPVHLLSAGTGPAGGLGDGVPDSDEQ